MSLESELVAIEKELWTGGRESYRRHVDNECLLAFAEMAGVSSRDEVAEMVESGERWGEPEIDVEDLLRPTGDVALLTYRAAATRGDDEHYRAVVTSGYVERAGGWKLMFHQQTPLAG